MQALTSIHQLSKSFSDSEMRVLIKYLTSFEKIKLVLPKSLLLLDFVRADIMEVNQLLQELDVTEDTLRKLAERLLDKMLETLTLELNVNRLGEYTPQGRANIFVRKCILRASVLPKRGLYQLAINVLKKGIRTARKYELFVPLLEALYLYYQIYIMLYGDKNPYKIQQEIKKYEKLRLLEIECNMLLNMLHNQYGFVSHKQFNKDKYILELINKISLYTKNSARMMYYSFTFKQFLLENKGDYTKAINLLISFIDFIQENKIVYKKRDHGVLLLNLSNCYLSYGNYNEAILSVDEACHFFDSGGYNYCNALELKGYIYIYSNQDKEAEKVLNQLLAKTNVTEYLRYVYTFLLANILFIRKDYKQVLVVLSESVDLKQDKSGWNFAIRLLLIMTHMEMKLLKWKDQAMLDFENLKRYRNRAIEDASIKERCKLIVYLINAIQREGYNYTLVGEKEKKYIDRLSEIELNLPCVSKSANIILFSQWLNAKINKIDFVPDYSLRFNK
ncbi:MAG: tetratricopeptide (TPR) repeat protein [Flavobacteriaceae bacterium]|jgi:tetratricopeptide (TPR) repeat protein